MKLLDKQRLEEQMAKPTPLRTAAQNMTQAWYERQRIFNELTTPRLTDERLDELHGQYAAAVKDFDDKRDTFLKGGKK